MSTLQISGHSTPKYASAAVDNSANSLSMCVCVCVYARNVVKGKGLLNSHDLNIESPFSLDTTPSLSMFVSLFVVIVFSRGAVENVMYFPWIYNMWFPYGCLSIQKRPTDETAGVPSYWVLLSACFSVHLSFAYFFFFV